MQIYMLSCMNYILIVTWNTYTDTGTNIQLAYYDNTCGITPAWCLAWSVLVQVYSLWGFLFTGNLSRFTITKVRVRRLAVTVHVTNAGDGTVKIKLKGSYLP